MRLIKAILVLGTAGAWHPMQFPQAPMPRASHLRACSTRNAPPAPPPHETQRRHGGGDEGLLLASMTEEERQALVQLWRWDYELSHSAEGEDARAASFIANWAEEHQRPWLSVLRPRSWRAGFGPGSTEALIVTRYELDTSHWQRALAGKHVLVVDQILLSPSVPSHLRGVVHAAVVQAFVLYGEYHAQKVRYEEHGFGI